MNSDVNFSEKIISGQRMLTLKSCNSTNNVLEALLQRENLNDRFIVQSDYQTSGKGMLQNSWISDAGCNLLFSLYCQHEKLQISNQFYLSKAVSIAIAEYLATIFAPSEVNIKWPNDLLVSSKKIAGVLIKSSVRTEFVQNSIIGIGLNVNQLNFPDHFRATSMRRENEKSFKINLILENLITHLDGWLEKLQKDQFKDINETYHNKLFGFESYQKYRHGDREFEARILEVAEDGHVMLEEKSGRQSMFEVKEIALISR